MEATALISTSAALTSLLIVVGVAMDTVNQVEAQLIMRHYEGFTPSWPHSRAPQLCLMNGSLIDGGSIVETARTAAPVAIVLFGSPGSGKGTQSKYLVEWLGIPPDLDRRHAARTTFGARTEIGAYLSLPACPRRNPGSG